MKQLTLASLFDGSGGFPLAGILAGIVPVWASEIEPFPVRVTTKRMPWMKHYGDVSEINGAEVEPVDIITFGSPCQDMSVAGKRAGIAGARSGLFYEAIRIIEEMREATNGEKPRWCVWENVTGAYSSNGGEDFRAVLEAVTGVKDRDARIPGLKKWEHAGLIMGGSYSIAWRTLDAQYWGVPQRRKRIFLVADFNGGSAGKVLFESESMQGDTGAHTETREDTTGDPRKGTHAADIRAFGISSDASNAMRSDNPQSGIYEAETARTLDCNGGNPNCNQGGIAVVSAMIFNNHANTADYKGPLGVCPAIIARCGTGGNQTPFVVQTPKTVRIRAGCEGGGKGALVQDDKSATLGTSNDQTLFQPKVFDGGTESGWRVTDVARTIDTTVEWPFVRQGGTAVVALQGSVVGRSEKNGPQGCGYDERVSFTLNTVDRHAVAALVGMPRIYSGSANKGFRIADAAPTLDTRPDALPGQGGLAIIEPEYIVRRLTPTECARLQGFPDWWCDDLGTDEPTEEEIEFWAEVFETHRRIVTGASKSRSRAQIIKWLKNPHTDGAEYKMWGNGVALPCVEFVLSGIAREANNETEDQDDAWAFLEADKQMSIWDYMR